MECCPRNGQQLELSCIYLLNGYITEGTPEILNEMFIVSLVPRPHPAFCRLQYGNIVVLLISWHGWECMVIEHDQANDTKKTAVG